MSTFDVIVVGYGPVGQFLTLTLARKGYQVCVLERWPDFYPLPRAVHFDDEIARLLQSVGITAIDNPKIEPYDATYAWRNAEGKDLLVLDWAGIGPSGWHAANFFSQPELEEQLHDLVAQEPNATVLRGWEVTAVEETADGVAVTARSLRPEDAGAMSTKTVHGTYVVGCDGANSFVRRTMDVEMHDLGFQFDWLIVDMIPNDPMTFDPPAWQWCNPEHPTTVVPGGPGRRRWEFMRLPHETIEELNREETAWERMADWGLTPENSVLERHAVYTFRAMWAKQWRKGRLMLAGDAAHLTPPFAGQGMCAGIRDAANLAWKLDAVLSGRASDALLDTYGPERTEHVKYWIEFAVGLGNVICITDPEVAADRDRNMFAVIEDPSLAPPPPPPAHLGDGVLGAHPAAGRTSIQGFVDVDGRVDRFDDVFGVGWRVISTDAGAAARLSAENAAWAEANGVRLLAVGTDFGDENDAYATWLKTLGAEAVVVRPDFYVYDAGDLAGLDGALTRLREQLHATAPAGAV